jgi:hypothetical protein
MLTTDADAVAYDLAVVAATVDQQAPTLAGLLVEASEALTVITSERDLLRQAVKEAFSALQRGLDVDARQMLLRAYRTVEARQDA